MEKKYNFKLTEKEIDVILAALNDSEMDYHKRYGEVINRYTNAWMSIYGQAKRKQGLDI